MRGPGRLSPNPEGGERCVLSPRMPGRSPFDDQRKPRTRAPGSEKAPARQSHIPRELVRNLQKHIPEISPSRREKRDRVFDRSLQVDGDLPGRNQPVRERPEGGGSGGGGGWGQPLDWNRVVEIEIRAIEVTAPSRV